MQKLIAKYGLAAHLALLAVAPLFLFPFCDVASIARVLVWLTLPATLWTVLEPSIRGGEQLHDARRRVVRAIFRDPLFWASLVLVAFTGFRALNTGIALSYDAEASVWQISAPPFPILPGVVGASGDLPFAAALACSVLMQACRHSLGRSARMAYLLLSSTLSGLAAVLALVAAYYGCPGAIAAFACGEDVFSFVGLAFGIQLIGGMVALVAVFEQRWNLSFLLLTLSLGGNGAGLFAFSSPVLAAALATGALLMLGYAFAYSIRALNRSGEFRLLVVAGISLTLGGLLTAAILPEAVLGERLAAFKALRFIPESFWTTRETLSAVAFKSWLSHIWIGTGLASFPLDFRFNAPQDAWRLFPRGVKMLSNGWLLMLCEQGIVGTVFFILPFGFLLFTYVRRLVGGVRAWEMPHPACFIAPLALLLFVAVGFFDCSLLRVEVLMATCALLAVSAASFPRMRGERNG